jgi:hypothetical protein
MSVFFKLPKQTKVSKNIPKKAFDSYTNTKQKNLFVEVVESIRWQNKLSVETLNIQGDEIQEIQIFEVKLRKKEKIEKLIEIIDKSIPYHIIFILTFENEIKLSVSSKHIHPTNENNAIIDWTFASKWILNDEMCYQLNLKESLDFIIKDLCIQLSGKNESVDLSLQQLIEHNSVIQQLKKEINTITAQIKKSKQFNKKVELNTLLKQKQRELILINKI